MSGTVHDTDSNTRRLFEVILALNGGRQIKTEAFFWASSPGEANLHAVRYWKQYSGSLDKFSSQNIDGSQTAEGACHESFGIYGHGSMSMNIMVRNVTGPSGSWGVNLLKRVLKSRGLSAVGGKQVLAATLCDYVDKSWQRPLYEHEKKASSAVDDTPDAAVSKTAPQANSKKRSAEELNDTAVNKKRATPEGTSDR